MRLFLHIGYLLGFALLSGVGIAVAFDTVKTRPARVLLSALAVLMAAVWPLSLLVLLVAFGILVLAEHEASA